MTIKIRDRFVLITGIVLVLLGGFQIAYNLESFQIKDFILGGLVLAVYTWLHYQHKYKGDKALFDEYYSEKFYKSLEYGLGAILIMIAIMVVLFEKENIISVNYIYGAIRLGMGLWLLYFSYLIMIDNHYEQ